MNYAFANLLGAPYRGGNLLLHGTELLSTVGNRVSQVRAQAPLPERCGGGGRRRCCYRRRCRLAGPSCAHNGCSHPCCLELRSDAALRLATAPWLSATSPRTQRA